jgi:hypothetical protein
MITLSELVKLAAEEPREEEVSVQIDQLRLGKTQNGKPFYDLETVDARQKARFKIWGDTEAFEFCSDLKSGDLCELSGRFFVNQFGLNVEKPQLRFLSESETE